MIKIELDSILGIFTWIAPLLMLILILGKTKSIKSLIILRCIYVPFLILISIAFLWVWFGDGIINLWLVPLVFAILILIFVKYVTPRLSKSFSSLDLACISIGLSSFLTIWIVVLIYKIIGLEFLVS